LDTGGVGQPVIANFFVGSSDSRGGIRPVVKNLDGDNLGDIVTGAGDGDGVTVQTFAGKTLTPNGTPPVLLSFPGVSTTPIGGVFVG